MYSTLGRTTLLLRVWYSGSDKGFSYALILFYLLHSQLPIIAPLDLSGIRVLVLSPGTRDIHREMYRLLLFIVD